MLALQLVALKREATLQDCNAAVLSAPLLPV